MNPCFDDSYPRASADVLLEGTREEAERRGLLWMAPDVITFVIAFRFIASVWKRSNSQYLTACFRDHTGRQRRITTKETDRKKVQSSRMNTKRRPGKGEFDARTSFGGRGMKLVIRAAEASFECPRTVSGPS